MTHSRTARGKRRAATSGGGLDTAPRLDELVGSGEVALDKLEHLSRCLDDPGQRGFACTVLHELAEEVARRPLSNLWVSPVDLPGEAQPARLFLHPAVFAPEDWGRTFAEGLLKCRAALAGRTVAELGTGSGWIGLLLLKQTEVASVIGLDINPVAVTLARLNAFLNGTGPDGSVRLTMAGRPLPDCFQALRSDLLDGPIAQGKRFDLVIGCIPQVLHPDRMAVARLSSRPSVKDLYDLSNYCFAQGVLEDRFGLPLVARALEQSQLCLNANGQVILVLGGRPGPKAIEAMFARRGFLPSLVWTRRIRQADDTDLTSLVSLEDRHDIRFNFFVSVGSDLPVPASTAVHLLKNGRPVYHDLLVYQGQVRHERVTCEFVRNLNAMGLDALRKELDFSRMSEEQISFLAKLSHSLLLSRRIPYPHERGDLSLRQRLARFLAVYCQQARGAGELFIGPERGQLLALVMRMTASSGRKVLLSQNLDTTYTRILSGLGFEVVLSNEDLAEALELDTLVSPVASILAPRQLDHPSPVVLDVLAQHAAANPGRLYIVDDSAHLDISSSLSSNVFLRLAGQRALPPNLVLIYGLTKNTVCPDFELSFFLNAPPAWMQALEIGAELTYSRIAYPTQLYYEWLFDDLLSFPLSDKAPLPPQTHGEPALESSPECESAAADPVFRAKPIDLNAEGLIRLDYGELEAPVPDLLIKGLLKGFIEGRAEGLAEVVKSRVASYLMATRGSAVSSNRIVLAQGVFPLFGALLRTLGKRLGRPPVVALPDGTYGPCYPAVVYHGGVAWQIPTQADKGFLVTADEVRRLSAKPDLLWLTQPNNPSGLFLDTAAVRALMRVCAEREIFVLADEIFFLLSDHRLGAWTPPQLSFAYFLDAIEKRWLFLVDGLSKAFAAGGLRCGFMACPDEQFANDVQERLFLPPQAALRAWDVLYSAFLDESPHLFMDVAQEREGVRRYLQETRLQLSVKRERLLSVLRNYGKDDRLDTNYRGGLFLLARLADEADKLAITTKLLVNPAAWARTPGWARLCFSLEPARFDEALERLELFLKDGAR